MFLKVLQVIGKDSRSDEHGIHNLGGEGVFKFCGPNGGRGVVQDCCFCQSTLSMLVSSFPCSHEKAIDMYQRLFCSLKYIIMQV